MNHCNQTPSEIVERFKFHTRVRRSGESVATYVSELRSLARFCKFGSSLEDTLRDRIVRGPGVFFVPVETRLTGDTSSVDHSTSNIVGQI